MTEYDYSPDAIERYHAKMEGVGKWARQQSVFAPTYANPFVPEGQVSSRPRSASRQNSNSSSPHRRDRPEPTRSQTLPASASVPAAKGASYGQGLSSRVYTSAQQGESRAPHPSSSRNYHRPGPQTPAERYPYPVAPPAPAPHLVSQQASMMAHLPPAPPGSRQRIVNYSPGQPIVLPPPRPGETYVIVPPKGGGVRTVAADPYQYPSHTRSPSRTRSHSQSHSQGSGNSGKHAKRTSDTLYKRLLTNLTPNIEWGDSSRSGRSMRRDRGGDKRRSASR